MADAMSERYLILPPREVLIRPYFERLPGGSVLGGCEVTTYDEHGKEVSREVRESCRLYNVPFGYLADD